MRGKHLNSPTGRAIGRQKENTMSLRTWHYVRVVTTLVLIALLLAIILK